MGNFSFCWASSGNATFSRVGTYEVGEELAKAGIIEAAVRSVLKFEMEFGVQFAFLTTLLKSR